jgi:hypothetical protein
MSFDRAFAQLRPRDLAARVASAGMCARHAARYDTCVSTEQVAAIIDRSERYRVIERLRPPFDDDVLALLADALDDHVVHRSIASSRLDGDAAQPRQSTTELRASTVAVSFEKVQLGWRHSADAADTGLIERLTQPLRHLELGAVRFALREREAWMWRPSSNALKPTLCGCRPDASEVCRGPQTTARPPS